MMYLKARVFHFVKTADLDSLKDLPDGTTTVGGRQHNVRFSISADSSAQILEGSRRVKC